MNLRQIAKNLFPDNIYCIRCGKIINSTRIYSLCDDCIRTFHWANKKTCDKCGKIMEENGIYNLCKDCRQTSHYFTQGFTCLMYGLYEKELLWAFKYGKQGYMAEKFAEIIRDRLEPEFENGLEVDVIIPVPIHRKKLRERGFNQAELMARPLSKIWALPLERNALIRAKSTSAMSTLDTFQRRENIAGAFVIREGQEGVVRDKSVLLVDDVYTTGSTVDECSRILLECGAKTVYVITLAAGAN